MAPDHVTLREHFEALRAADQQALKLAREIQDYKDEKANDLRSQIESERGLYLTAGEYQRRHEALESQIDALADRVNGIGRQVAVTAIGLLASLLFVLIAALANLVVTHN